VEPPCKSGTHPACCWVSKRRQNISATARGAGHCQIERTLCKPQKNCMKNAPGKTGKPDSRAAFPGRRITAFRLIRPAKSGLRAVARFGLGFTDSDRVALQSSQLSEPTHVSLVVQNAGRYRPVNLRCCFLASCFKRKLGWIDSAFIGSASTLVFKGKPADAVVFSFRSSG